MYRVFQEKQFCDSLFHKVTYRVVSGQLKIGTHASPSITRGQRSHEAARWLLKPPQLTCAWGLFDPSPGDGESVRKTFLFFFFLLYNYFPVELMQEELDKKNLLKSQPIEESGQINSEQRSLPFSNGPSTSTTTAIWYSRPIKIKWRGNNVMTQRFELQPALLIVFLHNIAVCHVGRGYGASPVMHLCNFVCQWVEKTWHSPIMKLENGSIFLN